MNKNDSKFNFLLVGHEGSHNRGCEALVRSTVDILRKEFPESYITVASRYPEHDVPLLDIERLEVIPGVSQSPELYESGFIKGVHFSLLGKCRSFLYYFLRGMIPHFLEGKLKAMRRYPRPNSENGFKQVRHLKKYMLSANAVISIGGDLFKDEGVKTTIYDLETVEYAQFLGCKTIVWGASIWAIKMEWLKERIKMMLENCSFVSVRDDPSFKYLSCLSKKIKLQRVGDGAFLMLPKHSEQSPICFDSTPSLVVGFNGSPLLYGYMTRSKARQGLFDIIEFLRGIIDDQNCCVVLVPHDAYPAMAERDFLFEIMQQINRPDCVYMPPIGLDGPETKALIGQCDLFIGMRFHATIAALSQSIPTLGLSYSPKFKGLHQDVYGHTDLLIPYSKISSEKLFSKFKKLLENRYSIKKELDITTNELRKLALTNGDYIKDLFIEKK